MGDYKEKFKTLGLWLWYGWAPLVGLIAVLFLLLTRIPSLDQGGIVLTWLDHLLWLLLTLIAASAYIPLHLISKKQEWSTSKKVFYFLVWPTLFVAVLVYELVSHIVLFGF